MSSSQTVSTTTAALTHCTEAPAIKTIDLSTASLQTLMTFGTQQHQRYVSREPFPHIIIDNLFTPALLEAVLADVSHPRQTPDYSKSERPESEHPECDPHSMGPTARRFLLDLCSARFCLFLEALTGIKGLIPDPYFEDGGLHTVTKGGVLEIPTPDHWHSKLQLNKRLSMLIYLNPDWDSQWGGQLELWNAGPDAQRVSIPPLFNKTVIFSTTDCANYGYPAPLQCPDQVIQRSLSLHYYSNRPPAATAFPQYSARPYQEARPAQVGPLPRAARGTSAPRRKSNNILQKSLQKSLKKSVPQSLIKLYKAGKRSLRG